MPRRILMASALALGLVSPAVAEQEVVVFAAASLKTALDGGLSQRSHNVLVYATSNRRHLMPEYMAEAVIPQPAAAKPKPASIEP